MRRAGYSLIDVVIAVLLMGVMAAVATPNFAAVLQRKRVEAAAMRVKADLTLARQAAIASSAARTVHFDLAQHLMEIPALSGLDHPQAAYRLELAAAPYRATIFSYSLGGDHQIIFDRFGRPDGAGEIVLRVGVHEKRVAIDADTGKASVL